MSADEWASLSTEQRNCLFEEYERDLATLMDYRRRLIRSINYRPLGILAQPEPLDAQVANEDWSLSDSLDVAVSRLTQLRSFQHEPAYLMDRTWGTRWRRVRFHRRRLSYYTGNMESEEMENLQLSLAIRALGLSSAGSETGLRHLDLLVTESAFWGCGKSPSPLGPRVQCSRSGKTYCGGKRTQQNAGSVELEG
ncbi:hypothetical protein MPH_07484 [Macrophomina phaseolina MS6]|uniref:Uncharacterized protein n=1 Tax=Macrophomina phaseolina (strain MS6) TaxID=1126212 RepID=K2RRD5_MACPH|nr:hypothetical protein MPH_07484 [Macrophomina phaseolina MS6]